jgi:hypothetical protein
VVAVGAPAKDVQEKVQLPGRRMPAQFHLVTARRSSIP